MDIFIVLVAMLVVGAIASALAGVIWRGERPYGLVGDYLAGILTAIAVGLLDWYVIPAMGFSDRIRLLGIAIEPLLGAFIVLWIIRKAKR